MGKWRTYICRLKGVLFSLFAVIFLGITVELREATVQQYWLVRIAQGLAVAVLIYSIISQFVESDVVKKYVKWIIIPIKDQK